MLAIFRSFSLLSMRLCPKPLAGQSERRRSFNKRTIHLSRWHYQAWRRSCVPELCIFHPTVRLIIAIGWLKATSLNKLSTVHTKNRRKILEILARDHLQPTSSRPLQAGQHGYHRHVRAMEMDRTIMWCEESRATFPAQPFTGHQRGSGKRGRPTGRRTERSEADPEETGVAYLWLPYIPCSQHNGHEWVRDSACDTPIDLKVPDMTWYSQRC